MRRDGDDGNGIPLPISLVPSSTSGGGVKADTSAGHHTDPTEPTVDEKMIMDSTGCMNLTHIRNTLIECHFSVDAALEIIIGESVAGCTLQLLWSLFSWSCVSICKHYD